MIDINKAIEEIKYMAIAEGFKIKTVEEFERACKNENPTNLDPAINDLLKNVHFKEIVDHIVQEYMLEPDIIEKRLKSRLPSI